MKTPFFSGCLARVVAGPNDANVKTERDEVEVFANVWTAKETGTSDMEEAVGELLPGELVVVVAVVKCHNLDMEGIDWLECRCVTRCGLGWIRAERLEMVFACYDT